MTRHSAFFMNGGAGRHISSIPALELYAKENPEDDFIVVCEGGTDAYKGHPLLHFRAYDNWHKNLFQDLLKNRNLVSPEPYRVWEYYNQKCSLAEAYDIAINKKGLRKLPKPNLYISKEELLTARSMLAEVKEKTGKNKLVLIQPFGRGAEKKSESEVVDLTGRSIELKNLWSIIKKLSKDYGVIVMSEFGLEFKTHGGINKPVALPLNTHIRIWAAMIKQVDHFVGCDSVGQHLAYAFDKTMTVLIGSTFPINTSFPNDDKVDIIDLGEKSRIYSPIRITSDEYSDRLNEGIMEMDDNQEQKVVNSINFMLKNKHKKK